MRDPLAAALMERIDYDWGRIRLTGHDLARVVVRLREFDRMAHDFLHRNPTATVVHISTKRPFAE